jgi:hypothetical protein
MFIFRLTQVRTSKSEVQTLSGAHSASVNERGGATGTKYCALAVRKGGPSTLHVFVFDSCHIICRLYKLTISSQTQVIPQLRDSLSDCVKIFSRFALTGYGVENILFFHRAWNPLSAALHSAPT